MSAPDPVPAPHPEGAPVPPPAPAGVGPIEPYLRALAEGDGSDLFLTVGIPPVIKVQGMFQAVDQGRLTPGRMEELVRGLMSPEAWTEFVARREANLALNPGDWGRFRVNCFFQQEQVGAVIRLIRTEIKTMAELQLPPILGELMLEKRGLVLVTGATGSGKSTSLAAMIDHRNRNHPGHIITIEDPVEFVHRHRRCIINQREVGADTLSFHDALKNTLRQAPDIILLGEIRDAVAMECALNFAETGHLVLGTLHSNNANQTLERVLGFFPPDQHHAVYQLLSLNLKAIVSQRLIRTADGKGRAAALEILLNTPRMKDLIAKGDVTGMKQTMEEGTNEGMQTFDQALYHLAAAGRISEAEALGNADSMNNLRIRLKNHQVQADDGKAEAKFAFQEPQG